MSINWKGILTKILPKAHYVVVFAGLSLLIKINIYRIIMSFLSPWVGVHASTILVMALLILSFLSIMRVTVDLEIFFKKKLREE
jgi:hypothetical protein